jgi:lipoyl(octanoyl) transferase
MVLRVLDTGPASGAWNMAMDTALVETVRAGAPPVLRFYRWIPACLSLGRNQPARGFYDVEALRRGGVDLIRRPTGGRAVLHDHELTYSLAVRDRWMGGPRGAYLAVNRALTCGLRSLGVAATVQPPRDGRAPVPSLAPCFQHAVEGEVVVHGRKIVGSAQARTSGVLLQHGSLPLNGRQDSLQRFIRRPGRVEHEAVGRDEVGPEDGGAVGTLSDFLQPLPSWDELTSALAQGLRSVLGCELSTGSPTEEEIFRAEQLQGRFLDPAWTWRC